MSNVNVSKTGIGAGVPNLDGAFCGSQQQAVVTGQGHRPDAGAMAERVYAVHLLALYLSHRPNLYIDRLWCIRMSAYQVL